jgi:hypothetical protein
MVLSTIWWFRFAVAAIAYAHDKKVTSERFSIQLHHDNLRAIPYVSFSDNERLISNATKNQVAMNPTYVIF